MGKKISVGEVSGTNLSMWLGEETSFYRVLAAEKWIQDNPREAASEKFDSTDELLDELVDAIYEEHGNLAIITIQGSLTNRDSFWNLVFGLTSYNTIAAALNRAVEDENITDIILSLSTSGGDAEGIGAIAENIKVADGMKPVYAFSNTKALSAGYWIASAARKIYGAPMSEWGSVGAIVVHTQYAKALKERGLGVTVFRGGKYKALGHPAEELSDKAKKLFQKKVDTLYNFFLGAVTENRKALEISAKDSWAEGQVFFAEEAKRLKLVDSVTSFNDLISSLVKVENPDGGVAASGTVRNFDGETEMKKVVLDKAALAQLASGVPAEQIAGAEAGANAGANAGAEDGANSGANAGAEDGANAGAEDGANAGAESSQAMVAFLRAELKEVRAELAESVGQAAILKAENSALTNQVDSLKVIAVESTERLGVGINKSIAGLDTLSVDALIQQYSLVKADFYEKFKVGQTTETAGAGNEGVDLKAEARKIGLVPKAQ